MLFLMNKTKDQISWVSSRDLYWEKQNVQTKKVYSEWVRNSEKKC